MKNKLIIIIIIIINSVKCDLSCLMVTSYQKLYYLQTSVTLLTSIPITGKVLLNHKNMEICCLQLTIRLSAMTFRGMVNDAMAPKLTTIEESMVCCPQELLVEGYDHV